MLFKQGKAPDAPLRRIHNHPRLNDRPDDVWETIKEQRAIDPIDVGGARLPGSVVPQGSSDVNGLPKGIYPIRWVGKSGSDRVRICINMISLNKTFAKGCGAVELTTLSKIKTLCQQGEQQVTLDQHVAYYHLEYHDDARESVCVMMDDAELPPQAVTELSHRCPQCRWGTSKLVFSYRGLTMGCAPSATQYCIVSVSTR